MSKRLQVLLDEAELERIRQIARASGMTVADWVRGALRAAQSEKPSRAASKKLKAVRAAAAHEFPVADIDRMLAEIEQGYLANDVP